MKKSSISSLLFLFVVLVSFSMLGQKNTDLSDFREKIFLHSDKAYYNAGDDLWFKIYLVKADNHTPELLNKAAYVDLIGTEGDIVVTKAIKLSEGTGNGDFKLSAKLIDGEYTLRAYTNYMRNFGQEDFFTKKIYIKSSPIVAEQPKEEKKKNTKKVVVESVSKSVGNRPGLQFFPEGGVMLNGYFNRVAFKALGVNGRSMEVLGEIIDQEGYKVLDFSSERLGMGQIALRPESGKSYTAVIQHNGKKIYYKLPNAIDKGSLLQVMDLGDKYQLNISTTDPKGISGYSLIGDQKFGRVFNAELKGGKDKGVVRVPKDVLNIGIVGFTLFDGNGEPINERLVFNDNNGVYAGVDLTGSSSYPKNGKIELHIATDSILSAINSKGANLSVSVTEMAVAEPKDGKTDIRTYLLLDSELKGNIEQPGYYFYSDDPERKKHLDLLMLTQGWRQFTDEPESKEKFYKEMGVTVKGSVRNYYNPKKTDVATVQLTFNDDESMGRVSVKSDENGSFKFIGLDIMDDNKLSFTTEDPKRPMRDFRVKVDPLEPAPVDVQTVKVKNESAATAENYLENPNQKSRIDNLFEYDPNRIIELEGVEVEDERKTRRTEIAYKRKSGSIYSQVSGTVDMDDLDGQNFFDFLDIIRGRFPGVNVQGGQIVIRGTNSLSATSTPLFLLNGVEVDQDLLQSISVWDIDFIDVLRGSRAAIFGSKGMNGIVAVYTLTGEDEIQKAKEKRGEIFRSYGFYRARKFYEPGHKTVNQETEKQKYSSTLYWEPELKINGTGKSTLSFPSNNNTGSYKAVVQGVTAEGIPVASEVTFVVE